MAEYGIVIGFEKIKGNCQLAGFKEYMLVEAVSFSSVSLRTSVGGASIKDTRVSVEQSPVTVTLQAGKWTAELLQALYSVADVGTVTIAQLGQSVDKNSTAAPSVIQKVTLTKTVITGLQQAWFEAAGPRSLAMTLEFDKILFEIGDKPADFTLRNITEGAV